MKDELLSGLGGLHYSLNGLSVHVYKNLLKSCYNCRAHFDKNLKCPPPRAKGYSMEACSAHMLYLCAICEHNGECKDSGKSERENCLRFRSVSTNVESDCANCADVFVCNQSNKEWLGPCHKNCKKEKSPCEFVEKPHVYGMPNSSSKLIIMDTKDVDKMHYYNNYYVEVIDMMERVYGPEKTATFCELNAFKYRLRMGTKEGNPVEVDLAKEQWYLNKAKELRDKLNIKTTCE
jgi:hypothetical protein